ncbi:hypothetical protein [Sporosarcina sp. A2]|uniref:hypothetical protein n=1 Tax=Sporosarcina sp. A2 TaxID=3393449 RepID=UPI003D790734
MPVTDYFLLWKVTVPSAWLAAILGFFFAWLAVRVKFGKQMADLFGDALFTLVIVWKLSVIITDFETVRRSPMAILYFNGGLYGFLAGLVIAALFLIFNRSPKPVGITRGLLLGVVCAQSGYQVMMALLNNGSLFAKAVTLGVFVTVSILSFKYADHEQLPVFYAVGLFVAAHAFVAAIQPIGFTGIPFASTVVASVLLIILDRHQTKRWGIDGGIV